MNLRTQQAPGASINVLRFSLLHSPFAQIGAKGLRDSILQTPGNWPGVHKTRDLSHLIVILQQWNVHKPAETQLLWISHPLQGCCIPPGGFAKALAALPHAALCRAPEVKIPIWLLDQPLATNIWKHIMLPQAQQCPQHGLRGIPAPSWSKELSSWGVWLVGSSVAQQSPTAALACTVVSEHS